VLSLLIRILHKQHGVYKENFLLRHISFLMLTRHYLHCRFIVVCFWTLLLPRGINDAVNHAKFLTVFRDEYAMLSI
jgi:hypothetical protein